MDKSWGRGAGGKGVLGKEPCNPRGSWHFSGAIHRIRKIRGGLSSLGYAESTASRNVLGS